MKRRNVETSKRRNESGTRLVAQRRSPFDVSTFRRFDVSACRGFTIIEAIIAIVILALAIPPMMWSLREAHVARVNPILASEARWLATEKMEDIIADRHSETRGWSYIVNASYPAEPSVPGYPAHSRTVQIVETGPDLAAPAPGGGYKRVTVRVEWTDAGASTRSFELETVLTEYW